MDNLGEAVVVTVEHNDYDGTLRKVGDKANIYIGHTYDVLGSREEALVFEGETGFIGTDEGYFEKVAPSA